MSTVAAAWFTSAISSQTTASLHSCSRYADILSDPVCGQALSCLWNSAHAFLFVCAQSTKQTSVYLRSNINSILSEKPSLNTRSALLYSI